MLMRLFLMRLEDAERAVDIYWSRRWLDLFEGERLFERAELALTTGKLLCLNTNAPITRSAIDELEYRSRAGNQRRFR